MKTIGRAPAQRAKPMSKHPSSSKFPKELRLLTSPQFRAVFDQQQSVSDSSLVMFGLRQGLPYSRLGLAVSRKVGGAVVRNRWKRLIREAFRRQATELPPGFDVVVFPRRGAVADFARVQQSLVHLMHRLARRLAPSGK